MTSAARDIGDIAGRVIKSDGENRMRVLSSLKNAIVPAGRRPRKVLAGQFKGITLDLSLRDGMQLYLGLFERETCGWLKRLSRGIRTAIDVGAAHGEYSLFFLRKTGAVKVYAFEPDENCLPFLKKNLGLNGLAETPRLEIRRELVGESDGEGQFRLDRFAGSMEIPCLIKLDVDGAEEHVLRGAKALNARPGLRWLIETHSKELETNCLRILTEAGFQTKVIRNAWWRIIVPELRPIAHNRWLAAWKSD